MLLLAHLEEYQHRVNLGVRMLQADLTSREEYQAASRRDSSELTTAGTDAIIMVTGVLDYKFSFWTYVFGGTSYQGIQAQMRAAVGSEDIRRIVMVFDTPGGEVTGLSEAAKTVKNCPKPVVAVIDPMAASAGIWLASQAGHVVSIPSGEIGSIGCQGTVISRYEMLKKQGIDVTIIRSEVSPDKNIGHPAEALSDEARAYFQSRVNLKGEQFVAAVAEGRNVSRETVLEKFGQGRMLWADEALAVGLIDSIGTLEQVLSEKAATKSPSSRRSARLESLKHRR